MYSDIIQCCLRTLQTSSKDPFKLNGRRETKGKMDTQNIKSGSRKKSKMGLVFLWNSFGNPNPTCKISI